MLAIAANTLYLGTGTKSCSPFSGVRCHHGGAGVAGRQEDEGALFDGFRWLPRRLGLGEFSEGMCNAVK